MAFDRYKATTTICAICIYAVSYCQSIKDQNKSETIDRIVEANAEVSTNEDEDLSTYFDELYH